MNPLTGDSPSSLKVSCELEPSPSYSLGFCYRVQLTQNVVLTSPWCPRKAEESKRQKLPAVYDSSQGTQGKHKPTEGHFVLLLFHRL